MEGSKLPKPSDLRPLQIKTSKPLQELKFNRMSSNVGATLSRFKSVYLSCRRLRLVTDLHQLLPETSAIRVQITKPQTTRTAAKPPPKRKAEKSTDEIKPKIVKQIKIPDWDYKARYNQLHEKHTLLTQQYKKRSSKLEELEDLEKEYNT